MTLIELNAHMAHSNGKGCKVIDLHKGYCSNCGFHPANCKDAVNDH